MLRLVFTFILCAAAFTAAAESAISFNRDVRPILSNKCFACHGPSAADQKAGLRLDKADGPKGALTPREGYHVIKAGAPEESELWKRVTTQDVDDLMPPPDSHKDRLSAEELAVIEQWIRDGAGYQRFWSFIPPVAAELPEVENADWAEGAIDRWVMARLEEEGLTPQAAADKRTILRRVTFDLTGLPPTLEEIDAFLADDRPDAYAHLVDDLLSRPAYGEHMTRYWADLVRLADTNGMHKDFFRDFSPYRDWVIRSFNDNLPFDDFIKYQVAGDQYEDPTRDQLIASGFNRMHMIIDVGTALPEESLHKNVLDRVEAFGTAFLGLTVQCAQCHDHKYDPISQKEYYQLYGFFNNFSGEPETVREPPRGLQPPVVHLTTAEEDQKLARYDAEEAELNDKLAAIRAMLTSSGKWPEKLERVAVPWIWNDPAAESRRVEFRTTLPLEAQPEKALARFVGMSRAEVWVNGESLGESFGVDRSIAAEVSDLLKPGENVITAKASGEMGFAFILEYETGGEQKTFTTGDGWEVTDRTGETWAAAHAVHNPDHESQWTEQAQAAEASELSKDLEKLARSRDRILSDVPAAMVMEERDPPRETYFLNRGAYDDPGETVERGTPTFLPPLPAEERPYSRMDLAEWLVDPQHPLTARVAVNRIWQQFFGTGLVKTSEDFGAQGQWPSHPDLLDHLAVRFVESGWDVKALVRDIVLSNTYRQSSDADPDAYRKDPENRLLARGPRYRMDAEMIRDQILAVSGRLNREIYGQSVKPPQPPGLWEMVSMAAPFTYVADEGDKIYRRSLYTYWRRGMPPPAMTIMNAPSREYCVARRERTNTPLQALLLMNEPEYFDAARACAKLVREKTDATDEGLIQVYERITSQIPPQDRMALMRETLAEFRNLYGQDAELAAAIAPETPDAERAEVAAWTMLTHSLLNLELAKVKR
jgi:hypothetical protein